MRAVLVFLAFFLPLAALLWWLGDAAEGAGRLPEGDDPGEARAVLTGEDFADDTGATPFAGRIRELGDISVRLSEKGRIRYYFYVQDLARNEAGPRLESVTCAVFADTRDDTNAGPDERVPLRLTLEADAVRGDLPALVHGGKDAAKLAELVGQVVVRDAAGREIAQLDGAQLDLTNKQARSDGPVVFRMPDRDLEVRGRGLDADIGFERLRIRAELSATARTGRGPARLSSKGGAVVTRVEKDGAIELTIEDGAVLDHPLGTAHCERLHARVVRDGKRYRLARVVLEGKVRLRFDPLQARGVEFLSMARVTLEGDRRILCEGPLHAVRRGELAVLGLGERIVDLRAGRATVLLRRTATDAPGTQDPSSQKLAVEELRFEDGLEATDRNGGGTLRARVMTFVAGEPEEVDLAGTVAIETTDALVHADRVRVVTEARDAFDVVVFGARRLEYVADGRLGALGDGTRGRLRLTARGPVRARIEPGRRVVTATQDVVATVEAESSLRAQEMTVEIVEGRLAKFVAAGAVELRLRERSFRGDRLVHSADKTVATGSPAVLREGAAKLLRARSFQVDDQRRFTANGDVFVRVRPPKAKGAAAEGAWEFRCARATGTLPEQGRKGARLPDNVMASGPVAAAGPSGELLSADTAELRGELLILTGKPASLGKGSEVGLRAPRIEATLTDGDVSSAKTVGAAELTMATPKGDFARWVVTLRGSARFAENAIVVPDGATVSAFDKQDRLALVAQAGRARVELARVAKPGGAGKPEGWKSGGWAPRRLVAGNGVVVTAKGARPAKVEAERLVYVAGAKLVDVYGGVKVSADEWPARVRFKHVVFVVTKDGIDLKRASDIDIRRKAANR